MWETSTVIKCFFSLALGVFVGHFVTLTEGAFATLKALTSYKNDADLNKKNSAPNCHALSNKYSSENVSKFGINFVSSISNTGCEIVIERAISTLLSIIGICSKNKHEKIKYTRRPWSLMPSGSSSYLWTCRSDTDGIILRTSAFVKRDAKVVLTWLIAQDITTGLEGVSEAECTQVVESHHGGSILIRRICFKGSLTAARRDFVIVTSISILPDGTYIIVSRSLHAPDVVTQQQRKSTNGFVRGIIYTSGFVLRPIQSSSGTGCEIFFAAHLDMLGPTASGGAANNNKLDSLAVSVGALMEEIDTICSEDGDTMEPTPQTPISVLQFDGEYSECLSGRTKFLKCNPKNDNLHTIGKVLSTTQGRIKLSTNQIGNLLCASYSSSIRTKQCYESLTAFVQSTFLTDREKSPNAKEHDGTFRGTEARNFKTLGFSSVSPSPTPGLRQGERSDSERFYKELYCSGVPVSCATVWDVRAERDGVAVYEAWSSSHSSTNLFASQCNIQLPPSDVQRILSASPQYADNTLLQRRVLNRLDDETILQLLTHTAPHTPNCVGRSGDLDPDSTTDCLVVSGDEIFVGHSEGFLCSITSVDEICEESDDMHPPEGIPKGEENKPPPTRTRIILEGYVGVGDMCGGTNLTFFTETNGERFKSLPMWNKKLNIESDLFVRMKRIRSACSEASSNRDSPSMGISKNVPFPIILDSRNSGCAFIPVGSGKGDSRDSPVLFGPIRTPPLIQIGGSSPIRRGGKILRAVNSLINPTRQKEKGSDRGTDSPTPPIAPTPSSPKTRSLMSRLSGRQRSLKTTADTGVTDGEWSVDSSGVVTRDSSMREMLDKVGKEDSGGIVTCSVGSGSMGGGMSGVDGLDRLARRATDSEVRYTPDGYSYRVTSSGTDSPPDRQRLTIGVRAESYRGTSRVSEKGDRDRVEETYWRSSPSRSCEPSPLQFSSADSPVHSTASRFDEEKYSVDDEVDDKSEKRGSERGSEITGSMKSFKLGSEVSGGSPQNLPNGPITPQFIVEGVNLIKVYLGIDNVNNRLPRGNVPSFVAQEMGIDWQGKGGRRGVSVYSTMVNGSTWQAIKAVCGMKADKMTILDLLIDNSRLGEFDDMFDFGTLLISVDERTAVRRLCFKPVWPTAPRDFLTCTTWLPLGPGPGSGVGVGLGSGSGIGSGVGTGSRSGSDVGVGLDGGSILVCTRSAPDTVLSEQKGYVRGGIAVSGYLVEPCEGLDRDDPCYVLGGCKVTLVAHTDLGGSLPAAIINMLSTAAPLKMMCAIHDIVTKV